MIDLQQFCAKEDDIRYYLQKPWSRGEWTYATNGHIMVRVPRRADVAENSQAPDVEKLLAESKQTDFVPVPVCESPPDIDCSHCRGTGFLGKQRQHECDWCDGTGKTECFDGLPVGDANFAKRYLAMIQGWEIAPNGPTKAAWIRNAEATGLLMPRKMP